MTPDEKQLVKGLRRFVDVFADDIAGGPSATTYRVLEVRPSAVAWVYYTALLAWAQDHALIDPVLRAEGEAVRRTVPVTAGGWLAMSIASLCVHPATECLLDPRYSTALRAHQPSDAALERLLEWWTTAPSLAYPDPDGDAPRSITGWMVGDLLQLVSVERRKGFALAQSPCFIADFLLYRTLYPAAAEFRDETLLTTDPCCGTGHLLIRTVETLWELYTTGRLPSPSRGGAPHAVTGWRPVQPLEAARRIIAGVDGCELDPLTAAVARLRVVVRIGDLLHQAGAIRSRRLDAIPAFVPRIAVGDSLLLGKVSKEEYARLHPRLAEIYNPGPIYVDAEAAAEQPKKTTRRAKKKEKKAAAKTTKRVLLQDSLLHEEIIARIQTKAARRRKKAAPLPPRPATAPTEQPGLFGEEVA